MWLKNNLTKEEEIQGRLRGLARRERERKQGKGMIYYIKIYHRWQNLQIKWKEQEVGKERKKEIMRDDEAAGKEKEFKNLFLEYSGTSK